MLCQRRPIQLHIDEKNYLHAETGFGQKFIYLVQDHHVPVGQAFFRACLALADVVEIVRQPEMQDIRVRMGLCVIDHFFRQHMPRQGIGVAKVGVEGFALEKLPFAVHFGYQSALFL